MAAGLGFKNFSSGEVLTAADVNGYLMQGVGVFTDAANRDAEITSPQEGQFAYLKDTNVTTYYTGSAWANLDTTGMTNPMTTTGDTIYSSSGSTPARLGIGTTGQVLTVAGGVPTWAAAGGGGKNFTLLNAGGTSLSGTTTTISGISGADQIFIRIIGGSGSGAYDNFDLRINADSGSNYVYQGMRSEPNTSYDKDMISISNGGASTSFIRFATGSSNQDSTFAGTMMITGCNSSGIKVIESQFGVNQGSGVLGGSAVIGGIYTGTSTVSSISIIGSTSFDAGTVFVYTSA